ncbi:MAG: DUF58 domain-containing protein, partial [Puniceicoccaceae bacterium]
SRPAPRRSGRLGRLLSLVVPPRGQRNRPTISGLLLILVAVGIGVAAYNTASNILFLVLSFVLALLIVNGILSVLNFRKLWWEVSAASECRAGEGLSGTLHLGNGKKFFGSRAVWFLVRVNGGPPRKVFLRERIPPGASVDLPFVLDPAPRGRALVRVVGPESTFPFGFLRKQTGAFVELEVLVWPALEERIPDPPPARRLSRGGGSRRRMGSGTDLVQLREYQRGDPPRRIHWKATARTGRLMIRQLAEEGSGAFVLHVNCSETLWPDEASFEAFLSRVSTVAGELFKKERLAGYVFDRGEFRAVRHVSDLKALNDSLALAARTPGHVGAVSVRGNLIRFRPTAEGAVAMETAV